MRASEHALFDSFGRGSIALNILGCMRSLRARLMFWRGARSGPVCQPWWAAAAAAACACVGKVLRARRIICRTLCALTGHLVPVADPCFQDRTWQRV